MLDSALAARTRRINLPPAIAVAQQRGELFVVAVGRRADAADHVHRIAELLQDRIVRDRADLPQAHFAVGGDVRLAARHAAAGGVEHAQPEGGQRAGIGPAFQMLVLMIANRAVEIEA